MSFRAGFKWGDGFGAGGQGKATAGPENASRWGRERRWDIAFKQLPVPRSTWLGLWNRRQQGSCIGVGRVRVGGAGWTDLDDPAQIHDRNDIAEIFDHGQIVGNEQHGQAPLVANVEQEIEYLGLNGDIERRDTFIGNEEIRIKGKGPGNPDSLALPAGEFVGIAAHVLRLQPDLFKEAGHPVGPVSRRTDAMGGEAFSNDGPDPEARIERSDRILEDDLHSASEGTHASGIKGQHVLAIEDEAARTGLDQPEQGTPEGGLAGTGFANEADDAAPGQIQIDILDSIDRSPIALEGH